MTDVLNLIIQTTDVENESLITSCLSNFDEYYDGNEYTWSYKGIESYRHYYYDVPHDKIATMLKILHENQSVVPTRVAILPKGRGNYSFD